MAVPRFCFAALFAALLVAGAGGQTSDCTSAYNTLTPCLTYVAGTDAAPSVLCCNGITLLNTNSPACLCQVVEQLNNGSTPSVNVTKAYALPSACGVSVNTTSCPGLALPPGASIAPTPPLSSSPPPPAAAKAPASPPGSPASPASVTRPSPWVAVLGALAALGVSVFFSDFWVGVLMDF